MVFEEPVQESEAKLLDLGVRCNQAPTASEKGLPLKDYREFFVCELSYERAECC